jgi:hypothetical protein
MWRTHIQDSAEKESARAGGRETEAEISREEGRDGERARGRERPMCVYVGGKEGEREGERETHVLAG